MDATETGPLVWILKKMVKFIKRAKCQAMCESSEANILDEIFHIPESKNKWTIYFYRQRKYDILVC